MANPLNKLPRRPALARTTEDSIVLTLFDIANELGKLGDGLSAEAGLTSAQWLMLLQIAGDPNFAVPEDVASPAGPGVMASEIAKARGVSRASVSMLVAQLLRMGYVRQEEHPEDRRRKQLTVTDAGHKALATIQSARHEANSNLFASLTQAQRRQLLASLRACLERLWLVDRAGGVGQVPARPGQRRSA